MIVNSLSWVEPLYVLPVCLCRSSLFLVWDLLGAASDLNYWVHRPSCCWSLDQYYMKHIPSQGRIGLGSLGLVPGNDLKSRVLQGRNLWLVSEMWCVGCFDGNFLKQKFTKLRENSMTDYKGNELQKLVLAQGLNNRSHFSLQRTQSGRAKDT